MLPNMASPCWMGWVPSAGWTTAPTISRTRQLIPRTRLLAGLLETMCLRGTELVALKS